MTDFKFIPGLELSRSFYQEAVAPILQAEFPALPYAAALIGSGSEVLGYDTEMSTDHHWGPRLLLFLHPADYTAHAAAIQETLRHHLPHTFRGYPTNFGDPSQEIGDHGTQLLVETTSGPVNHRVEILTVREFIRNILGFDLEAHLQNFSNKGASLDFQNNEIALLLEIEIPPAAWLTFPQQKLLEITAGGVFHDDIGLTALRERFGYFPQDVWLYLLIGAWNRIGQDEHLAPRAGFVGDEVGSAVIAGRLVRSIMLLGFLMEKKYAPYPKWLGTAFARLQCGPTLIPILRRVQMGETWQIREAALVEAYTHLTDMHNALGLTQKIEPAVEQFHGRPFRVSRADIISHHLRNVIQDGAVRAIAEKTGIGSIDEFSDNTDLREATHLYGVLRGLYE